MAITADAEVLGNLVESGSLPRTLQVGNWLLRPLKHPSSKAILLPAGTILTQDLIEKIRAMGLEFDTIFCLGSGTVPKAQRQTDLAGHFQQQRSATERMAEAFGSMRDISFMLFCICAILAFVMGSERFAFLAGLMLVAMLVNSWLSLHILQRLSTLNRMFAGPTARARAT